MAFLFPKSKAPTSPAAGSSMPAPAAEQSLRAAPRAKIEELPAEVQQKWKEGLSFGVKKMKALKEGQLEEKMHPPETIDEIVRCIEDRTDCHWLERFDVQHARVRVRFEKEGDTAPRAPELEEYRSFLEKAKNGLATKAQEGAHFRKTWQDSILQLRGVFLEGARLEGSVLWGADLSGAKLQGSNLMHAKLQGADLSVACLQGADLQSAQLQGAELCRAQLSGAHLRFAQLQGAMLQDAGLQGANLRDAQLQGADLTLADLSRANLGSADLSGAKLIGAKLVGVDLAGVNWEIGKAPACKDIKCEPLAEPVFAKKPLAPNGALGAFFHKLLGAFLPWGEDEAEDSDADENDGKDESSDEDEREYFHKDQGKDTEDDEDKGANCPLLSSCMGQSEEGVREIALTMTQAAAEEAGKKLAYVVNMAEARVKETLKQVNAAMKPQVQTLSKILSSAKFRKAFCGLESREQDDLIRAVSKLAKTTNGKKFVEGIKKFEDQLKQFECEGMLPFITKLTDSHLQAATGYSSGELLAFLKVSPAQMASDMNELEDIAGYIDKLQETVNINNWDDIIDNFLCMYELRLRLKGERSRKVFSDIWKDRRLRQCVGVGHLFQEVRNPNDPPPFVLHEVKDAVQVVKKGAVAWKLAMKKEMAVIDLMKSRQQAYFQFMISCISGLFVFLATFFSGLLLDAAKTGRVHIPYFSNFLVAFNTTGEL
ncbi:unnamed protein product [Effrenium voratum]|nr:unnamed protein product [Effrenium voratum]